MWEWLAALGDGLKPRWVMEILRAVGGPAREGLGILEDLARAKRLQITSDSEANARAVKVLSKTAVEEAIGRDEYRQLAVERFVDRIVGKDKNLQDVAARTAAALKADPPSDDLPSVEEDWFNLFRRFAEDASSEKLQDLWSRVLEGEIRAPGAYSFSALQILSRLDKTLAEQLEFVAKYRFLGAGFVYIEKNTKLRTTMFELETHNLIYHGRMGLSYPMQFDDKGLLFLELEKDLAIYAKGPPGQTANVLLVGLSRAAREIMQLISGSLAGEFYEELAKTLFKASAESVSVVQIIQRGPGTEVAFVVTRELPKPS